MPAGRADQAVVVERLLSISGEDSITVDRKHLAPWTGTLPHRQSIDDSGSAIRNPRTPLAHRDPSNRA
jgi:hypothetical protein